jgi:four helix bundle protein
MFSLEKLKVYERALASVARLAQLSTNWDKRHAVMDQLLRASESVVLNIAEGNGRRIEADHRKFFELAEASLVKVGTYIQLCQRTGEIKAENGQRGLVLLDRVALLVRGLVDMAELD